VAQFIDDVAVQDDYEEEDEDEDDYEEDDEAEQEFGKLWPFPCSVHLSTNEN